jgi:hypothetical protein
LSWNQLVLDVRRALVWFEITIDLAPLSQCLASPITKHLVAHHSLPADAERERIFIATLPHVRIARRFHRQPALAES